MRAAHTAVGASAGGVGMEIFKCRLGPVATAELTARHALAGVDGT